MSEEVGNVALAFGAEAVRRYCEITNDYNPLHLDPEFAARTPFGKVIVHGTLALNTAWEFIERSWPGLVARTVMDVRFVAPVAVDEALTARAEPGDGSPPRLIEIVNAEGEVKMRVTLTPSAGAP